MEENKYLNEENYERIKKKLKLLSTIILITGIAIGLLLIFIGVKRQTSVNISSIEAAQHEEFQTNGFSEKYYDLEKQIEYHDSFIVFYMFGGFIIVLACMVSASIYGSSIQRELLAFKAQQMMPIAKESIKEMTPTASSAAKEMAESITEGIKEGLKDK